MTLSTLVTTESAPLLNRRFFRASLPWPRRRPKTQAQRWFASIPDTIQAELDSGCPDLLGPGMRHETPLDVARAFSANGQSVLGDGSVNVIYLAESLEDALSQLASRMMVFLEHTSMVSNAVAFELRELHVRSSQVFDIRESATSVKPEPGCHKHVAQEARTLGHDCAYFSYNYGGQHCDTLGVFDLAVITDYGSVRPGVMYYSDVHGGFTHYHWEPEPIPMSGVTLGGIGQP